jgi:hypothetical protein
MHRSHHRQFSLLCCSGQALPALPCKVARSDYAPIVLSGIVQTNNKAVTTKLEVRFQFHLPYCTSGGDISSLLIAVGPNIYVNTIIGLSFIEATGMILDFVEGMAECKHLDCPPFPIDYRRTSNHVPVISVLVHHIVPHEEMILKEIQILSAGLRPRYWPESHN